MRARSGEASGDAFCACALEKKPVATKRKRMPVKILESTVFLSETPNMPKWYQAKRSDLLATTRNVPSVSSLPWQAIERALGYGASALECGFGFIQYFLYKNHTCVHDRIAETIVVKDVKRQAFAAHEKPDHKRPSSPPSESTAASPTAASAASSPAHSPRLTSPAPDRRVPLETARPLQPPPPRAPAEE
jgi:hypothetical protein